ncbi:glycosyltransferase family 87 protein [Phytohabitans sp. ZYX-F-186]|uniref:Glycosyltransferase family 87 protein n=1 Tax=Phytohabitans maris TaxID=3071409 RepID=A0ABU0ZJ40_9ACTN|nr:glycosyltransferase family 87 protein [Phytohabitans sp. ZYX-F-186]MDQ7907066.1 glycosyltransferase family 87 protein [Phytohabitans sp. ZYX-F-186]
MSVAEGTQTRTLTADLALYTLSAAFAAITAATSTLLPHRAWGAVATAGYAVAAIAVVVQLVAHRPGTRERALVAAFAFATTALLPMVIQAVQRADGRTDRAQEEVIVIEQGGQRLLDHGTPYLSSDTIATLPPGEQLLGYLPYQPGMALFGLPRAIAGDAWWTDARIWFALATIAGLGLAIRLLERGPALLRALQLSTVIPLVPLTLATGGDDVPVLALCLLALAFCAARRHGAAGIAVGLAAALKLFAWPVAAVLLVHGLTAGRRPAARLAAGAIGLPTAALLPAILVDATAFVDNVIRFPLGEGVVTSPAQSPFPGHLIADNLPAGRAIAGALLAAAAIAIAVWLARRPPRTAAAAAIICGYGLLAAILLMPSTRFGYLLYPVAFLAWAPAFRRPAPS